MGESVFKLLIGQYHVPHPFLGTDGQAYPMMPYSIKQELLQFPIVSGKVSMDDLITIETLRMKQVVDAAYSCNDPKMAETALKELYPLMLEDIQSGNHIAVSTYTSLVDQISFILNAPSIAAVESAFQYSTQPKQPAQVKQPTQSQQANQTSSNAKSDEYKTGKVACTILAVFFFILIGYCVGDYSEAQYVPTSVRAGVLVFDILFLLCSVLAIYFFIKDRD